MTRLQPYLADLFDTVKILSDDPVQIPIGSPYFKIFLITLNISSTSVKSNRILFYPDHLNILYYFLQI